MTLNKSSSNLLTMFYKFLYQGRGFSIGTLLENLTTGNGINGLDGLAFQGREEG